MIENIYLTLGLGKKTMLTIFFSIDNYCSLYRTIRQNDMQLYASHHFSYYACA